MNKYEKKFVICYLWMRKAMWNKLEKQELMEVKEALQKQNKEIEELKKDLLEHTKVINGKELFIIKLEKKKDELKKLIKLLGETTERQEEELKNEIHKSSIYFQEKLELMKEIEQFKRK